MYLSIQYIYFIEKVSAKFPKAKAIAAIPEKERQEMQTLFSCIFGVG